MAIHITNLLEYGGTAEDLIWKSDTVNFNNNSHVVVRESQEAIYVSNGVMSNTMGAGRHVLKSGNIPGLRQIRGFFQGEKAISTGEVYFFNLSVVRPIQWGTKEFVQIVDPIYQIPVRFGAGGTMYVRIGDSRKLLKKLTGTQQVFTRKDMDDFLRGILTSCVRNYLANEISSGKVSPLEFDKETERLSKKLEVILTEEFENYGLYLEKFYIERIPVKEEDTQTIRNVLAEHGARQLL